MYYAVHFDILIVLGCIRVHKDISRNSQLFFFFYFLQIIELIMQKFVFQILQTLNVSALSTINALDRTF